MTSPNEPAGTSGEVVVTQTDRDLADDIAHTGPEGLRGFRRGALAAKLARHRLSAHPVATTDDTMRAGGRPAAGVERWKGQTTAEQAVYDHYLDGGSRGDLAVYVRRGQQGVMKPSRVHGHAFAAWMAGKHLAALATTDVETAAPVVPASPIGEGVIYGMMTPSELADRADRVSKHVPITIADRGQMAFGLFFQGYSAGRACQIAFVELEDSDGALQMLGRHRLATPRPDDRQTLHNDANETREGGSAIATDDDGQTLGAFGDLWDKACRETDRLSCDLDISNADHIVLWLENQLNGHIGPLAYIACRILDAHEAALARAQPDAAVGDDRQTTVEPDAVGIWREIEQEVLRKGLRRSPKYYPAIGETCRFSGPNCDDAGGYTWSEVKVLWADDLFVVTRVAGCWPTITKHELVLFEPRAALKQPDVGEGGR